MGDIKKTHASIDKIKKLGYIPKTNPKKGYQILLTGLRIIMSKISSKINEIKQNGFSLLLMRISLKKVI